MTAESAAPSSTPSDNGIYFNDVEYERFDMHTAASIEEKLDVVKQLVNSGVDVNTLNRSGWAPLHYAALLGNARMLAYLLDSGARINMKTKDESERTPLMLAACCGHKEVVGDLLRRNADPNIVDSQGRSPLYHAVSNQHNGVVEYLLALHEINVDTRETLDGYTPLMYAAMNNFNRMVELLLKKGARIELTTTSTKENAYQLAKRNKAHEAVATIEQYMDKRRRNAFLNNAQQNVMSSAQKGNALVYNKASTPSRRQPASRNGAENTSTYSIDSDRTPTQGNPQMVRMPQRPSQYRHNQTIHPTYGHNATMYGTDDMVNASAVTMANISTVKFSFAPDESLPKNLRIYLVDRLNMKKEYDILMGRYPTLTIEQFINMEEEDVKACIPALGPRRKVLTAIGTYKKALKRQTLEQQNAPRKYEQLQHASQLEQSRSNDQIMSLRRHVDLMGGTLERCMEGLRGVLSVLDSLAKKASLSEDVRAEIEHARSIAKSAYTSAKEVY